MSSLNLNEMEVVPSYSSEESDSYCEKQKSGCGTGIWRFVIALFGFFAMTNSYALRSHMSVTIVAMVGTSNSTSIAECQKGDHNANATSIITEGKHGEFGWDQELQGIVNSAFYYGYFLPQVLGGRLAEKYSAKWVVFAGGCLGTVATLLGPMAARIDVAFFIVTRAVTGFGLAVFQPCLHYLIARWAPPNERSIFSAIVYSGNQFGVVISMPIAGVLCDHASDGGWPWPFYVFGMVAAVWLFFWAIFVQNTPSDHPWISDEEKRYINSRLNNNLKRDLPVPWKKMFTSKSVWGLILCHFGYNWGFYTILTELPTYMSNVLGFTLSKNGVLSSLPYLMMMIVGYLSSYAAFQVLKRDKLPVVVVRKGLNTIAFYGSALSLLTITFLTCQTNAIYGMLMLAVIFFGLTYAGFQINHVDLTPNYAGTLQGITNTAACIPGIVSPYVVGVITNGDESQAAWSKVFYISMSILLALGTWYLVMGSANLKSWNEPKITDDKEKSYFEGSNCHVIAIPNLTSEIEKTQEKREKNEVER